MNEVFKSAGTGLPMWTSKEDKRGIDPLGMQTTSVALYQELLPGISNVTLRMRYYGFYAWLAQNYAERIGDTSVERWCVYTPHQKQNEKDVAGKVAIAPTKIKWTRGLRTSLARGTRSTFSEASIGMALHRPFSKSWLYLDSIWAEYKPTKIWPSINYTNLVISVIGVPERKGFSCLVANVPCDLHMMDTGQVFPLYWYEQQTAQRQKGLSFGDEHGASDDNGFIKRDGISDVALETFRKQYSDPSITKEDIFFYVYGILHSSQYREQYEADLKKVMPRVPFATDFRAFEQGGRKLAKLHLDFEIVEPWPVQIEAKPQGDIRLINRATAALRFRLAFFSASSRVQRRPNHIYA